MFLPLVTLVPLMMTMIYRLDGAVSAKQIQEIPETSAEAEG